MKLREEEFYNQYHQHGGTTIIPTEIFNELYDDATEEIERLNQCYCNRSDCGGRLNQENKIYNSVVQRIEKAIHRIQLIQMDGEVSIKDLTELVNILKGRDKK